MHELLYFTDWVETAPMLYVYSGRYKTSKTSNSQVERSPRAANPHNYASDMASSRRGQKVETYFAILI